MTQPPRWHRANTHRRRWVFVGVAVVAGSVIAGSLVWRTAPTIPADSADASPTTVPRYLDGVPVTLLEANRLPLAVVIDNSVGVRPQSGLGAAKLVFESLAEGGITRLLAVYDGSEHVDALGPVRSARPAFVSVASGLGALFAHAGGSPDALALLRAAPLGDLDQLNGAHPYFIRQEGASPPHHLFTSSTLLAYALRDGNHPAHGSFVPWTFRSGIPLDQRPVATPPLRIDFSTFGYEVVWTYDRDANQYVRSQGGDPHVDALTGQTLTASAVVVQVVPTELANDGDHLIMELDGQGSGLVTQNGGVRPIIWTHTDLQTRTVYTTDDGQPLRLVPGTTWVEMVTEGTTVTTEE